METGIGRTIFTSSAFFLKSSSPLTPRLQSSFPSVIFSNGQHSFFFVLNRPPFVAHNFTLGIILSHLGFLLFISRPPHKSFTINNVIYSNVFADYYHLRLCVLVSSSWYSSTICIWRYFPFKSMCMCYYKWILLWYENPRDHAWSIRFISGENLMFAAENGKSAKNREK